VRSEGESRLGRWARLKAEARAAEREAEAAAAAPVAEQPVVPTVQEAPQAIAETEAPEKREDEKQVELPPLDSLTKDSDFSLFMRGGVSADARKAALRKLWTLDSHFAQIDISECHSIDFNAVPTFPEGLKNTIYRAGRGMVEAVEEIERQEREAAEKARMLAEKSDSHDAAPVPSDDPSAKDDSAPPTGQAEASAESPKTKHS
jgi:hypothetical protein